MEKFEISRKKAAEVCHADIIGPDSSAIISKLLTDSRSLQETEGCVFVALSTSKNDGHKYVEELYSKGVRCFLLHHIPLSVKDKTDICFLLVPDTLKALQSLVAYKRSLFDIPVVAITGSNGKTIVKEWLSFLLEGDKRVVKNPKSYNSQIGVPLSVWAMSKEHQIGVFEAGISEPEEMEALKNVIQPTYGIFTNIGSAHDQFFINNNQKIVEKLKLFMEVETLVYCADHVDIRDKILQVDVLKKLRSFTWSMGKNEEVDLFVIRKETRTSETWIEAVYKGANIKISLPFLDKASLENAMHCWAFMLCMGYDNAYIAERMMFLQPIEMRMEMKEGRNACYIINDFYNSDLNSLQIALDFLSYQQHNKRKCLVLSDILQSGKNDEELYAEIAYLLERKKIDVLVGIGDCISRQADQFTIDKMFFQTTDDYLSYLEIHEPENETILLKGARAFSFEKISRFLQKRDHETVLEINMNALENNFNYFRSLIRPQTGVMVMGKAASYGCGSYEVANMLSFHKGDYIAVAYADEGVLLRKKGIQLPIMVMNPEQESMDSILRHNLEPEIYSFRILEALQNAMQRISHSESVKIHIKIDTGMHRLGFEEKDIKELTDRIKAYPAIVPAGIFTHLATADNPELDAYTLGQLELFDRLSEGFQKAFSYKILRHALNTAGIARFPEYQMDMVRLGIGLYGVGFDEKIQEKLENVTSLRSLISQIREVKKGDYIGYAHAFQAQEDMRIGVVPIGYADGLNRHLGNRNAYFSVKGYPAPIVGNVCMDMCMIDLSNIPEAKEKDPVIVFGKDPSVSMVAKWLGTIPYEVLTGVSQRVKRVYYKE